jgi:cobalt-precorrin-5B (C1)-methyltransferase
VVADFAREAGAGDALAVAMAGANTTLEAFTLARADGVALGEIVARRARMTALGVLAGAPVKLDVLLVDRDGVPVAHAR